MSRQHQDPNRQSGHHQTSYPYPPQQQGQYLQPLPNTYNDRPPSQHAHPSYPEGQHPPSGQGYGSRSPNTGTISFPEPHHGGSASHPQAYVTPSQNLTVATHHERRGSHGHPAATGSSFDDQRLYPAGAGSDTGGSSNFYSPQPGIQPYHGGGYTATAAQHQDLNAADPWSLGPGAPPVGGPRRPQGGGNSAAYDEGHESLSKAPPYHVSSGFKHICRYPHCNRPVFVDRRVNEPREWCSDQHMQAAIAHGVEKACKNCGVWPRRNGFKYCSGNACRYR